MSSYATKFRKVEPYANLERLGAATTNRSKDGRMQVISGKEHMVFLLHLRS